MGRPRLYDDPREKYRTYRQRRRQEIESLRTKAARPPRHPRHEHDFYPTPPAFIRAALSRVTLAPEWVVDAAAGDGRWGQEAKRRWPGIRLAGVELRPLPQPEGFDFWMSPSDFLTIAPEIPPVDLVLMNPPYSAAEPFIRAGLSLLRPGGELVALLRLAFREGRGRARGLFAEHPLAELAVCDRRPRFYGQRGGMTAFAVYRWQEGCRGATVCSTAIIEEEAEG